MRTIILLLSTLIFSCCGPSAEEKAAYEYEQQHQDVVEETGSPNTIKSAVIKVIFKNGIKDTMQVSYYGYLELQGDCIIDIRPKGMHNKTIANDVSAFSVLEPNS